MTAPRNILLIAATSAAGLLASGMAQPAAALSLPRADDGVRQSAATPGQTIVGLGDSYMSGEGVMTTNKHFKNAQNDGNWTHWFLAPPPYGGDLVVTRGNSIGTLDTTKPQVKVWGSVFGDKNGWPRFTTSGPIGQETIPFCDRSLAAPMFIGSGFAAKNLACSGAIVDSVVNDEKQGGFFGFGGTAYKVLKPGIDFKTIDAPGVGSTPGQAQLLQDYATQQKSNGAPVKVVALSIGGNDFGFADIAKSCITSATLDLSGKGAYCNPSDAKQVAAVTEGIGKAKAAVTKAVKNVTTAMKNAGYAPADWTLIYQPPPLPIADGANTRWSFTGSSSAGGDNRGTMGGCALPDATFDWIAKDVYPKLVAAMGDGLKAARQDLGDTNTILFDHSKTMEGHRLCEKGTIGATNYPEQNGRGGGLPKWEDNNGIKTEWINEIDRQKQIIGGNKYQNSSPLHPNFWGQRALADCMAKAVATVYGTGGEPGSRQVGCTQAANPVTQNAAGRPDMKLSDPAALWISAVGQPTVTGAPHPGQTLTANTQKVFAPADPAITLSYEWQADGAAIAGAAGADYTPAAGDVGKQITVKVTAAKPGVEGASATSQPVTVSDILMTAAPTITGTPKVGETLTVNPGTYTPAPDSESFQWLVNGKKIPGATGTTYTPNQKDAKQFISVTVTATKATYSDLVAKSAAVGPVDFADLTVTGAPTISGKAQVGQTLTAGQGTVQFNQSVDTQHYEWFADGKIIAGADQATYVLGGRDVGKRITVRIIGFKEGHSAESGDSASLTGSTPIGGGASSGTSAPTAPVAKAENPHGDSTNVHRDNNTAHTPSMTKLRKPTLVDRTLTREHRVLKGKKVRYGTVAEVNLFHVFEFHPNNPEVSWFLKKGGNKVVKLKNKGLTWQPKKKHIGLQVHAEVTTRDPGFVSETVDTDWYAVVKGSRTKVKAPRIRNVEASSSGKVIPSVGGPLKATEARFLPGGKVRYQWYAGKRKIKGATSRRYTPTAAVVGKKLSVRAQIKKTATYKKSTMSSKHTGKTVRR